MLPPIPPSAPNEFIEEPFAAPGLEPVQVLRPARELYRPKNANAPALVLLPGLGMDCRGFIKQFPLGALAHLHMIQANNEAVEGEDGFGHFARIVEEYILAKGLDKHPGGFVLGGCSMGGALSMCVTARGKVRPRALLLLGTFADCKHLPYYQRALAPLSSILPIHLGRRAVRKTLDGLRFFRAGLLDEVYFLVSGNIRRTHGYYSRAIMALTRQKQLDKIAKLQVPTLVMHGTHDGVLPHAAGEEIARTIPGAKFISIKNGGHGFFYQDPNPVNAAAAEFLLNECGAKLEFALQRDEFSTR